MDAQSPTCAIHGQDRGPAVKRVQYLSLSATNIAHAPGPPQRKPAPAGPRIIGSGVQGNRHDARAVVISRGERGAS
jgi:hypothetical protein